MINFILCLLMATAIVICAPTAAQQSGNVLRIEFAAEHRMPEIYFQKELVTKAVLCPTGRITTTSFGARRFTVDKILKGAKPAAKSV